MKPTKDWFALLPEPYRSQAVENFNTRARNRGISSSMIFAINSFYWQDTPEGYKYWDDACDKFKHLTFPAPTSKNIN